MMQIDKDAFVDTATKHGSLKGFLDRCEQTTSIWLADKALPEELMELLESSMPKVEIWAGAGTIFDELNLIKWNKNFPEALRSKLLIFGTAPNGDHIAIDLNDGGTGYISHEHDWRHKPRDYFIGVSRSIGSFLRDVNKNPPTVPEDFWDAKDARS
jgi:hypothetical protein